MGGVGIDSFAPAEFSTPAESNVRNPQRLEVLEEVLVDGFAVNKARARGYDMQCAVWGRERSLDATHRDLLRHPS